MQKSPTMQAAEQISPDTEMTSQYYYEQPLNERIRFFLRLEKLFQQFAFHIERTSEWNHQIALESLIELMSCTGRSDIKLEALKELERLHSRLERLTQRPQIDHEQLSSVLKDIEQRSDELKTIQGQLGQELQSVELLSSVRQKNSVPGCICSFDLPAMSYWHNQPDDVRQEHLKKWFEPFRVLEHSIQMILDVLRQSTSESDEIAQHGFFNQTINSNQAVQLLRIAIPEGSECYPEISAGKHRFSVRFMSNQNPANRPEQCPHDIHFKLGMCSL